MNEQQRYSIETFLSKPSEKPKIIVIYGPTASGKTGLSIEVARYVGKMGRWEDGKIEGTYDPMNPGPYSPFIISADARQVYRYMNIGTGKVTEEEMQGIPHHMLDILDPSEAFSVVDFRNYVENLDVWKKWNHRKMGGWEDGGTHDPMNPGPYGSIPIICGGTGLYIDSLIFERSYPGIEADWQLREELEQFRLEHGNEALWNRLHELDPGYAAQLHPNDRHYIIRGIEVFMKTGKSKSAIIDEPTLKYDTLFLTPYDGNRETLYERINERVQGMFNSGLVDEVQYIMNTFGSDCPGLATIGYKEVVQYLKGEITLEACITEVQQHNRNYAKRQITWNKKYGNHITV